MDDGTRIAYAVVEALGAICVSYVVLKTCPRRHYPRFFALIAGIATVSAFQLFQAPGASFLLATIGIVALMLLLAPFAAIEAFGALFKTEVAEISSASSRSQPRSVVPAIWPLLLGVFIGMAVTASFVASVVMPPAYIGKWIFSAEPLSQRIAMALNPGEQWVALRQKEREASAENKRLAGIEAELQKAQDELGKLPPNTPRNVPIKIGSGLRVAGGAIYVGVYNTKYWGSLCVVNVNSDKGDDVRIKDIAPGEAISVLSSRGKHRVVLTAIESDSCTFDIVKD
ncbi:MAG: hypothetical protein WA265_07305 [Rhodomicrobium sp.]